MLAGTLSLNSIDQYVCQSTNLWLGLEVIKLEYSLRLKIKRNDWLLAVTCRKQPIIALYFESENELMFPGFPIYKGLNSIVLVLQRLDFVLALLDHWDAPASRVYFDGSMCLGTFLQMPFLNFSFGGKYLKYGNKKHSFINNFKNV